MEYQIDLRNAPQLVAALERILIESDRTMATGSRDITDWQDDNRRIGDIARNALKSVKQS